MCPAAARWCVPNWRPPGLPRPLMFRIRSVGCSPPSTAEARKVEDRRHRPTPLTLPHQKEKADPKDRLVKMTGPCGSLTDQLLARFPSGKGFASRAINDHNVSRCSIACERGRLKSCHGVARGLVRAATHESRIPVTSCTCHAEAVEGLPPRPYEATGSSRKEKPAQGGPA